MSQDKTLHAVTGAFGYSGQAITGNLIKAGHHVVTLTGHPNRHNPFGEAVKPLPFNFNDPEKLARSLENVRVLYNTYWVRFNYGQTTFDQAVRNTQTLINAAAQAGVERFVHVSITNPSSDSPLPYFRGKAILEDHLRNSGLSYAILRPTVLFGGKDVLINNIAWILRRLPIFGVPRSGSYKVQPIHVRDLAELAVKQGTLRENVTLDAVGPEIFRYIDLVRLIAQEVGSRAWIIRAPRWLVLAASAALGLWVRDVVLTTDEIDGLSGNLLVSDNEPTGQTSFTAWLKEHSHELGMSYASEIARHYDLDRANLLLAISQKQTQLSLPALAPRQTP